MNTTKLVLAFLTASFLAACGGGSGVDASKSLKDLTADEKTQLCEYFVADFEVGEKMCDDNTSVTTRTTAECAGDDLSAVPANCTVETVEACADSTGGDPCKTLTTAECVAYIQCVVGG